MNNTTLLHAIGGVGDDLIERASYKNIIRRKKFAPQLKWFISAACFMMIIAVTIIINHIPVNIDYPVVNNPPVYNPNIGGAGNEISNRYFPIAENIYVASQVIGQETAEDWYVNIYLSKEPLEAIGLPALYQMINYFGIGMEELALENANHIGSVNYLDEYVINALYQETALMMYLLRHPLALYFDGEIYTYYEMRGNLLEAVQNIPSDVKAEYFALIEAKSEADETLKELKDNIDAFWQSYETGIYP